MSPLAGTLYEGLLSQVVNDTALIDALFDRHRCIHAYLDVGTNIGVQIWKTEAVAVPAISYAKRWGSALRINACSVN